MKAHRDNQNKERDRRNTKEPIAAGMLFLWFLFYSHLIAQTSLDNSFEHQVFDKFRWTHFTIESGLPSDQILSVAETADSVVWVNTSGGIAWFDGYQWKMLDASKGLPNKPALNIYAEGSKLVCVMRDRSIFYGDRSGFKLLPIKGDEAIPFFDNSILIRGQSALYRYKDDQIQPFHSPYSIALNPVTVPLLFRTQNRNIWLNSNRGLVRFDGHSWRLLIPESLRVLSINSIVEDLGGHGVVSLSVPVDMRGLFEWNGPEDFPRRNLNENGDRVISMDVSPKGEILSVYASGEVLMRRSGVWTGIDPIPDEMKEIGFVKFRQNGDLWIGGGHGLYLFKRDISRWTFLKLKPPFKNRVHEILKTRDGHLWLGTADGLEIRSPDGTVKTITAIAGSPIADVTGLAEDDEGNVWISSGASFDGVYEWNRGRWKHVPLDSGHGWLKVHKIRKDNEGRLWFLGLAKLAYNRSGENQNGDIFVYQHHEFSRWPETDRMFFGSVYAFAEGRDSALWFGGSEGLKRWKNGVWKEWKKSAEFPLYAIFTLAIDRENNVWCGDRVAGLACLRDDGQIEHFTASNNLVNNEVWDIQTDSLDRVWISTQGGLNCYDHGQWLVLDGRSGLITPYLWPILPTSDKLYVGTIGNGLGVLNLADCAQPPPRLNLDEPLTQGDKVILRWRVLSYWGNPEPEAILTRYRINTGAWSVWSAAHSVVLENLAPGKYSYEVDARNKFGYFDSTKRAGGGFERFPPFYLRSGFIFPLGGLSATIIFLWISHSVRKRKDAKSLKRSEARFRLLTDSTFEGILIYDATGILDINKSLSRMFGYELPDLYGRSPLMIFSEESKEMVSLIFSGTEGNTAPFETVGLRKDGSTMHLRVIIRTIPYNRAEARVVSFQDITFEKTAEKERLEHVERLRDLVLELSTAEERERRRIASYLHDTISQELGFCKMKLGTLKGKISSKDLVEVRNYIEDIYQSTKALTRELGPPVLYELGLKEGLEWLAEHLQERHGIPIRFIDDKNDVHIDEQLRNLLFQSVRELCINAIKHAKAHHITITWTSSGEHVSLCVKDDGVGFDELRERSDHFERKGGTGLFNIRERMMYMGGRIDIQSELGHGSSITITAPLHTPSANNMGRIS